MSELFRESAVGQAVKYFAKDKWLQYPEEREDFHWAPLDDLLAHGGLKEDPEKADATSQGDDGADKDVDNLPSDASSISEQQAVDDGTALAAHRTISATPSHPYTPTPADVERAITQESQPRQPSVQLAPTKTSDGTILVSWYTTDDPANPQNWSKARKLFVWTQLCLYTFAAYGASSMYASSESGVMSHFGVGATPAALGLAIYVIGYGVGPLLFAPLSEIASVGRNWVYAPTFFLFVILSIPTAVVDNYAGLMVLRFLTGFFSSPCTANGGASIGDMYSFMELPMYLSGWTVASFWGPALGPVVTGFAVQAKGWRWGLWEIVWLSAPILIVFLLFYPETNSDTILRRRAQRLRRRTGNMKIMSQSEIDQRNLSVYQIAEDALIKPMEIFIKDPAVTFTNVYTALTYGIYYSFFEVFPLVYMGIYNFSLGTTGLTFVTIGISCILGVSTFLIYQIYYLIPDIKRNGLRAPEHRLVPALFGVVMLPAGFFLFGWTARTSVHWIVSLIGACIVIYGNFLIFQSVFIYLPLSYPRYAASLFAGNDFLRAMFAAACVLFSRPMFLNLGIGGGVSLLAGLSCLGVVGMFCLWWYGAWLRSRSTFAN